MNSDANHLLMVFNTERANRRCLYLIDPNLPDSPARYLLLPKPFYDKERLLKVVGSCNGLLCLSSFGSSPENPVYYAMILNPSTGKVIANVSFSISRWGSTCSGFAYDGVNDDYRLVVVEYVGEYLDLFTYRKVMVYSVKSKVWRVIENTYLGEPANNGFNYDMCVPLQFHLTTVNCVLMNNYLMHWLLIAISGKMSISCFNFENEQWAADVPLPDFRDFKRYSNCAFTMGIFDGCLCLSARNQFFVYKVDVWIMKEYGVQDSWTSFSVVGPSDCDYYNPIFAYENSAMKEVLVTKSRPNRLGIRPYVWLNIRHRTAKKLLLSGSPTDLQDHMLCIGTFAAGCGDCQSQKRKGSKRRMKSDNQVKVLQANLEHSNDLDTEDLTLFLRCKRS